MCVSSGSRSIEVNVVSCVVVSTMVHGEIALRLWIRWSLIWEKFGKLRKIFECAERRCYRRMYGFWLMARFKSTNQSLCGQRPWIRRLSEILVESQTPITRTDLYYSITSIIWNVSPRPQNLKLSKFRWIYYVHNNEKAMIRVEEKKLWKIMGRMKIELIVGALSVDTSL